MKERMYLPAHCCSEVCKNNTPTKGWKEDPTISFMWCVCPICQYSTYSISEREISNLIKLCKKYPTHLLRLKKFYPYRVEEYKKAAEFFGLEWVE